MKIAVAVKAVLAAAVLAGSFAMPAAAHGLVRYTSFYYDAHGRYVGHETFYCDGHYEMVGNNGPVIIDVVENDC